MGSVAAVRSFCLLALSCALLVAAPTAQAAFPADASGIFAGPVDREILRDGWRYRADPRNAGLRGRWEGRTDLGSPVSVPHSANPLPVTGTGGSRSYKGSVGWYWREIRVEHSGSYLLRFESAHHKAIVWLDGRRVGRTHTGAYLPFERRVDLEAGRVHLLAVRLDWRSPTKQKRDGWHRGWFNFGGLNREVSLQPVGASELVKPSVRTVLGTDEQGRQTAIVDLGVGVRNHAEARQITVSGEMSHGGRRIPITFPTEPFAQGRSRTVRTQVTITEPALWSQESPNLYEIHLKIGDESHYRLRTGLRELTWSGSRLFMNGAPITLRGASLQEDERLRGDALLPADQDRLVAQLRRIGANATRAQHRLDPGLLERLDAAGIVIWQHIGAWDAPGNWTSRGLRKARIARERVRRALVEDQHHPSIVAWNLANEVAGNGHPSGQISYITAMTRELHRRDPGRMVAADIWGKHMPSRAGRLYRELDAIGLTSYIGWYEHTFESRSSLAARIRARQRRLERLFPGKVLVVTEFGAEGNSRNADGRHGGRGYQARLIGLHLRTYRAMPKLSGALVWALTDFALAPSFSGGSISSLVGDIRLVPGINQKGLIDRDGREKPALDVARDQLASPAWVTTRR